MLEEEVKAMLGSRSLMVRRGRNNRIYHKFILSEIFEERAENEEDLVPTRKTLGKRKHRYKDPYEFFMNETMQNNRVALN